MSLGGAHGRRLTVATTAALLLASCATRPPPVAPAPAPARLAPPVPVPVAPPPADWRDAPLSPGDWVYGGESGDRAALYNSPQGTAFVMRCAAAGRISFARPGTAAAAMTVRTSFGERTLPVSASRTGEAVATLAASDALFDEIAFSRGRFLVQTAGAAALVLPTWPEAARVIEDCRG